MTGRGLIGLLVLLHAISAQAQVYRWTDAAGRVHYTDRPPSVGAKSVTQKSASAPVPSEIEPFVLQQARKNSPVKLYSAPGCQPCDAARKLLNGRGVPFSEVSVGGDPSQIEELQKATGVSGVPALLVGKAVQSGFEEGAYHRMLDEAGYPKAGVLPARQQVSPEPVNPEPQEAPKSKPTPGPYTPSSVAD